jgi:two-component system, cell cycle response regulator
MAQILLVDDEKVARLLYSDFLTGAGHTVTAVNDAEEARSALVNARFDAVVTDLMLPHADGMDLLQHSKLTQPDVPVLVITALDKVEPAVRAIKSGASDYLVKPITPEVLAHAVNRALTQRLLLRENQELRRHVSMLDAGQRIATTLDRELMLEATGKAFSSLCLADAVVIYVRDGDTLALAALQGFPPEQRDDIKSKLATVADDEAPRVDRAGQEISVSNLGFETAYLVPVLEGDVMLGSVLMLFKGDIPEAGVAAAPFLARHLGLALKNLGKFAEVEDLAYLDDLTHLFNSRYLQLVLDKEFKSASKTDKPFSLLFLDLDYFKSVNDTHGHVIGSKLLVEVARVLKGCVRDNDVISRWGGDEYVALLRGTDSGGALKVAERIRRAIEQHRFLAREGFGLTITTCIGVASFPEHAQDKDALVDVADRAMYRGKKGTRNIIYMAAKNLEAPPASRREATPAPALPAPKKTPPTEE